MNAIGFRDAHNSHGVRVYARHGSVVSYERAQCVVWTPPSFATETSVVWAPSGFCDVHSTHDVETNAQNLSYGRHLVTRRTQCARREDECLLNVHSGSYGNHRVSRRTHYARRRDAVSYGRHRVSRQSLVSYGHHLVFATCTVRTTPQRGIV